MRYLATFLLIAVFDLSAFSFAPKHPSIYTSPNFINSIEGTVLDPYHRPVSDLWVELLNEFNVSYARLRTAGNGRFTFSGIRPGHYSIKVNTTGTDFESQTVEVDVINIVANASDTVYQDINLKLRKKANSVVQITDAIFVQEVPDEARRHYKSGLKELAGKDLKRGEEELIEAIKIYSDYYDALNALGCSYVETKQYIKALPHLIKSIDINQRSFSSFYALAYAAFQLNQLPEAGEAARGATILQPNSANALLLYGTVLRMQGNLPKALENLLKAEKLTKDVPMAEVHWQLALLYNRQARNKDAADQLEIYLKINPENANRREVQELIKKLRANTSVT